MSKPKGILGHSRATESQTRFMERVTDRTAEAARDFYEPLLDEKQARIEELEAEIARLKGGGR